MLRSLSTRLLFAFTFVILLSLALSAIGTLFLLRDQQQQAAKERVGRLAEPITLAVALMEQAEIDPEQIQLSTQAYADAFDVRVLLVDATGQVVADSESRLAGQTVDVFGDPSAAVTQSGSAAVTQSGSASFRTAQYTGGGEDLLLFAPAGDRLALSSNRLIQLQAAIYGLYSSADAPEGLALALQRLLTEPEAARTLELPALRPLVAVSEKEITSAWRDLIPQLAIAGGIALLASALAAALISRSISGRLGRVTLAAQEMARGYYDQQLDPSGDDEVGRLARAFNVMARQVSGSHQMMRDLLANVSHELKTPLTSIQGFSQAMEEGAISSPDEYRQAGRIINQETQRMRRLVDDLIELSRLESGQAQVEREPVDLARLLRACAGRFDWQLRESGAEMRVDVPALPELEGDQRRLEQVFSNLIDNAVRHTPKGGTITVRAEAQNGVARVAVRNTGSFIPPDELPRVFERFFQTDRNRASGASGAGLGLAIASEVVQAHRGAISATSDREQGTEFVVTLPVPRAANGAASKQPGRRKNGAA
ncbi:MAG: HAMP domain-containing protein [Chloroflexi bacterium]|nr:HAMP domain-containing protein [Chloroflexota bacterium]